MESSPAASAARSLDEHVPLHPLPLLSPRLLILGWDGADWDCLNPLLERGALPHLTALLARSSRAALASFEPRLSPLLWTSAVTGVSADRHGVLHFVEPDDSGVRLVSSTTRRCRALWNLLHHAGRRVKVINWYASHPAEPVHGVVVSNQFVQASEPPPEAVHPHEQQELLQPLRVVPEALSDSSLRVLLPALDELRPGEEQQFAAVLRQQLARSRTVQQLALALAEPLDWDCLLVFQEFFDVAGHQFMAYAPPRLPHISERQHHLFGGVIEAVLREHDRQLGELLAVCGDDTTVMLLSDHGFHGGIARPALTGLAMGDDRAEQEASWHRPLGVLAMAGPGVRAGISAQAPTLFDITPTALAVLGLPRGADMDGRVLSEWLIEPPPPAIPSWESLPGDAGLHPSERRLDPFEAHEGIRQLVELGYLAALPAGTEARVAFAQRESRYNLAVVYARSSRPEQAIPVLEELVAAEGRNQRYRLLLGDCLLRTGQGAAAEALARAGLERQPMAAELRLLLAAALVAQQCSSQATEHLALVKPVGTAQMLAVAELERQLGNASTAEALYRRVLASAADQQAVAAHLGLARLALARGDAEAAAESCLDAHAIHLWVPEAHQLLAEALQALGLSQEANHSLMLAEQLRGRG